jgi:formylglycine-generating enzyme required for sulfatase activity
MPTTQSPFAAPAASGGASPESGKKSSMGLVIAAVVVVVIALAAGAFFYMRPKPVAEIAGMVYVPAGTFLAGADKHPTPLHAFFIDATEVTNAQFAEFCRATGCPVPSSGADLPVVNVTVSQARAFAKWKNKRLPTAAEWERAARGDKGASYPWGEEKDPFRANVADNTSLGTEHHLMTVKSFPAAARLYDLVGNAFEMVDGPVKPSDAAVSRFAPLLTPSPTAQEPWIALRGGSFNTPLSPELVWDQASVPERFSFGDLGFRCAKDPAP